MCVHECVRVCAWVGGVDVMCIQYVLACLSADKAAPDVIRLITDHSPCSVE